MTPINVTPPTSLPVTVEAARRHCRIDHADDDALLSTLIGAAVGYLDGWSGVLGRCIMPQTWRVEALAGEVVLPMPDVTAATVDGVALDLVASPAGPVVTLTADAEVVFTCALPDRMLDTVRVIILLMVGHWYANREAAGPAMAETPLAADMLIAPLRWRRV
jgi:hypothetical protein